MIDIQLKWWHVALLALAVAGLLAWALGWRPGAIVGLLGLGGAVADRERRRQQEPPDPKTAADDLDEEIDEATDDEETADGDDLHDDWTELGR